MNLLFLRSGNFFFSSKNIPVGIKRIWPVKGSLASWYPIGIGPAGEGCRWCGGSHGLWWSPWWCKLGVVGGTNAGVPDEDDPGGGAPNDPKGGGIVLVPADVGDARGFHGGWVFNPPGCLCRPMAIPTGILEPENS